MSRVISVVKDEENQRPVPSIWRDTIVNIANGLQNDTFVDITNVQLPDADMWLYIRENIADYGERLVPLPEATWAHSVCLYMGSSWDVLVDLYTEESGLSDLVLFLKVIELDGGYQFEIQSVHVP